jgi:hypothetical protein
MIAPFEEKVNRFSEKEKRPFEKGLFWFLVG